MHPFQFRIYCAPDTVLFLGMYIKLAMLSGSENHDVEQNVFGHLWSRKTQPWILHVPSDTEGVTNFCTQRHFHRGKVKLKHIIHKLICCHQRRNQVVATCHTHPSIISMFFGHSIHQSAKGVLTTCHSVRQSHQLQGKVRR